MKLNLRNRQYYFKEILAFLFLLFAIYFFRHEQPELKQAVKVVSDSSPLWMFIGVIITLVYVLLNGLMYTSSFRVVHKKISLYLALKLFLKRNLISVFLPGGGITSLAFFTKEIEKTGISRTKISFASYIYGVIGIASLVVVAVPVLTYVGLENSSSKDAWKALLGLLILVVLLSLATWSFLTEGWLYKRLAKLSPQAELIILEIKSGEFSVKHLLTTLLHSVLVEVSGMFHLYISMKALGLEPDLGACIAGYVIATLFLAISPFLRGLGAVEVSLAYILQSYGFSDVESISITLLYRSFEFWLPLLLGGLSFLLNKGNIILRVFPAILIFLLGLVNIISVLTPPIAMRLRVLHRFLPVEAIPASNFLVLIVGVMLVVCAAFLLRGLKNAWYLALCLCALSLFGHLSKAIDYEEASLALFVLVTLVITRKQYHLKGDKSLQSFGTGTALGILVAVIIYGITGFYFLDKNQFGVNFTLGQSVLSTLENFILLNSDLSPRTGFARAFMYSINVFGLSAIALLFYAFIKPYVFMASAEESGFIKAQELLKKYGRSQADYFKAYPDKHLFFSEQDEGFVAFKYTGGYAIALEEPVCVNDEAVKKAMIIEFENYCRHNGLKPAWYRANEESLELFHSLEKKSLLIGQESLVNINNFSLEGKDRKSMRNALNSIQKKGYKTHIYPAPVKDGVIQKLKLVSDEWLETMDREELVFSQGMFNWAEIKQHTIISLENEDEKVVAFLNIIPDYAENELTYDLIRKTADAPGGNMDALIIELINYGKARNITWLNMGLAPLSGIDRARDFPERTIKFAFEKLQQFRHYKGLRDFKDKFDPEWHNKYLIYENHYDLVQLPLVINKIMKP